jgi:hypothetical protein
MRIKFPKLPSPGDEREITIFILFPRIIKNELRWLETAIIHQKCILVDSDPYGDFAKEERWVDLEWVSH